METPERVRFRLQLAGPGRRALAWALDAVLRVAVMVVIIVVMLPFFALSDLTSGTGIGVYLLLLFVVEWLYGAIFESVLGGRTPGKMALSLRVVRVDGSPARIPDILLRNLVRGVDYLPVWAPFGSDTLSLPLFGVGVFTMFLDPKLRRIGDLVGGTVVVVEDRQGVRDDVAIEPPVTEDERQRLPVQVSLSAEELRILEAFIRRRGRLSPERTEELAQLYGPALSERTGIEADSWERVLVLAYARATGRDR